MAGYFITNRWSSESRDRACSGYAESRQRKTIVNRWSSESRDRACSGYAESRQRKTIVNRGTLLSDIMSGKATSDAVDVVSEPACKIAPSWCENRQNDSADLKELLRL